MPAGITAEVPPLQETTRVAPGDLLLVHSDGIPDACNQSREEFGESRLLSVIQDSRLLPASQICGRILDDVRAFTRGCSQTDDLTVLAAHFHGRAE
jgi:sigma-B regulation protein RsbU (phosphoserine phosphatase)